jgi:DNA-binding transcriptional ArsR family regulator
MKHVEYIFKALANRKRLEILAYLYKAKTASVGDIAGHIRLSIKSTSKHLLVLYHANFLEKERAHGLTLYALSDTMGEAERKTFAVVQKHF